MRRDFVRWGYPAWWCRITGGLEVVVAILVCLPATRIAGLILGVIIIAVATATVLRHRDFSHLMPLGLFAALLALTAGLPAPFLRGYRHELPNYDRATENSHEASAPLSAGETRRLVVVTMRA